jgi:hypothetical protein
MDQDIPYMPSIKNLHSILDAIQRAAVPDAFNVDFLKDLGFTSSSDRPVTKLLKFLGMLDSANRPQTAYREFLDHTRAKTVLGIRLRAAYDDLFTADKNAHTKTASALKGWFRTKTGVGDKVAEKMATTFRSLAQYADLTATPQIETKADIEKKEPPAPLETPPPPPIKPTVLEGSLGLVYRIEIHLPDTQNIDTYRAIFRALREELGT